MTLLPGCGEKEAPTEQVEYATVTGIVHYRYFNEVTLIEGAEVKIMDKIDTTGSNGKYTIERIPYGEHEITCIHPDYDAFIVDVDITRDNYLYDIGMLKSKFTLTGQVLHTFDGAVENAIVTLESRVDTTDENGMFEFLKVSPGNHNIQCYHPDYNTYSAEIEVFEDSANHIIIDLGRQLLIYVDTLLVEHDATVKYKNHYHDYISHITLRDSNFGFEANLINGGYYEFHPGYQMESDEYWHESYRFLLELPNVNTLHETMIIDSARLLLKILQFDDANNGMTVTRILADWDENTVTWNNMPEESDSQCVVPLSANDTLVVIDVTNNYRNIFGEHYGLIMRSYNEEYNCCYDNPFILFYESYYFGSSENLEQHNRPYVVVYQRR